MSQKAIHSSNTLSNQILVALTGILLNVLGIQTVLVLAPIHNCEKRFKL